MVRCRATLTACSLAVALALVGGCSRNVASDAAAAENSAVPGIVYANPTAAAAPQGAAADEYGDSTVGAADVDSPTPLTGEVGAVALDGDYFVFAAGESGYGYMRVPANYELLERPYSESGVIGVQGSSGERVTLHPVVGMTILPTADEAVELLGGNARASAVPDDTVSSLGGFPACAVLATESNGSVSRIYLVDSGDGLWNVTVTAPTSSALDDVDAVAQGLVVVTDD